MKALNKIIILLIILILIILCLIFLLKESNGEGIIGSNEQIKPEDNISIEEVFDSENRIQLIETKAEYFDIKKCIDKYSQYSKNKEYEALISIIPNFVKDELEIKNLNVYEKVALPNKIIRIDNIYKSLQTISTDAYEESTNICAYIVKGYYIDSNTFEKQELKMIIILDINNSTFLVVPQKYIEQKQVNLKTNNNFKIYEQDTIEQNQYNTFIYSTETAEDMAKEYFNIFTDNLIYDLEYVYNSLDAEYSQKRFGNYEGFKKYINENKDELNKIKFDKYLVNYNTDYIEYVCKDQYGKLYIFKEIAPMNFTLKLDTYTIETEKYKNEYKNATVQKKVMMNVDKWIQMLNNRDYTAAYNCLDNTFRNSNFGAEEKFKNYIIEKYPLHYNVEFLNFSSQSNLYIQKIKLNDVTNKEQKQEELSIIMQLNDEMNFVMSFEIK